jgi:hypothetical protein
LAVSAADKPDEPPLVGRGVVDGHIGDVGAGVIARGLRRHQSFWLAFPIHAAVAEPWIRNTPHAYG